jgi:DNA ligase-1
MRSLAVLTEELESRPDDADRVDALARYLRAVGRYAGALAGEWLVAVHGGRPPRPARLTQAVLADAAQALAAGQGMAPWLFDVGRAASDEAAEAIALLLPWPGGAPTPQSRPALAAWMAQWSAADALPPPARAAAIAAIIAGLDDAIARRWAVRAVCGLVKPCVDEWQWQRAWARAFEVDAREVAWWWHRRRDALLHDTPPASVPHPHEFVPLADAPPHSHDDLLDAWRRGDLHAEPRWNGVRVHVVRRGDDVAVWQRGGRLLNARLPAEWLAPQQWPDDGAIEAVLLAWRAGRAVALDEAWTPRKRGADPVPTLHLAVVDWHGDAQEWPRRRARLLARWPTPTTSGTEAPPAIFTTPVLPPPAGASLAALADAARAAGWSGLVLRRRTTDEAWVVRAAVHRIRAVLQYVPGDALAAGATAARALAFVECGFALWNRIPRSGDEQRAAMTAAMSGEFLPPPAEAPDIEGLRLLPLARLPIALPDDELLRLHAWLRANVGLRFGGVHAVAPVLVFELGFAEARPSRRHKLGATLVGARLLRWLHDAPPGGAQRAADLFPAG